MVADRNSTHASANSQRPSRRVYLPDQRSGSRTVLGADRKGNAGSSSLSSGGQSGGGSRSLAQSGGSPRTPERDLAVSNSIPSRFCGKAEVNSRITTAPTNVPAARTRALRSEEPRFGWQTTAAVIPAQKALSSSRR